MSEYVEPREIADGRVWASEYPTGQPARTHLNLEPSHEGDPYAEVSLYLDGDGPGVAFYPARLREVGLALLDRAWLIERGTGRTLTAEENVVRGEAVLRHTGHDVTGDFDRDVDRAIDLERQRREDFERRLAEILGVDADRQGEAMPARHDRLIAAARAAAEAADGTALFHAAEAAYWRLEAETLEATLRSALEALTPAGGTVIGYREPPEPPVGTVYLDPDDDMRVAWRRIEDGWHCGGPGDTCRTCPVPWSEVWEWNVGEPARARRLRKYGEHTRPLVRRLGTGHVVDAEIVDSLPPDPSTVSLERCPTCTSTAYPLVVPDPPGFCRDPFHTGAGRELEEVPW